MSTIFLNIYFKILCIFFHIFLLFEKYKFEIYYFKNNLISVKDANVP
jgi:hypothetical protein